MIDKRYIYDASQNLDDAQCLDDLSFAFGFERYDNLARRIRGRDFGKRLPGDHFGNRRQSLRLGCYQQARDVSRHDPISVRRVFWVTEIAPTGQTE